MTEWIIVVIVMVTDPNGGMQLLAADAGIATAKEACAAVEKQAQKRYPEATILFSCEEIKPSMSAPKLKKLNT